MSAVVIVGAIVIVFLLAVWWLSFHPDFGLRPVMRWPRDPAPTYGADDPGPIATTAVLR